MCKYFWMLPKAFPGGLSRLPGNRHALSCVVWAQDFGTQLLSERPAVLMSCPGRKPGAPCKRFLCSRRPRRQKAFSFPTVWPASLNHSQPSRSRRFRITRLFSDEWDLKPEQLEVGQWLFKATLWKRMLFCAKLFFRYCFSLSRIYGDYL